MRTFNLDLRDNNLDITRGAAIWMIAFQIVSWLGLSVPSYFKNYELA
jgi:hypothetical protein